MDRVRDRVTDRRVLLLVKAFLKAGVLDEYNDRHDTLTGTPQGGILSPLLANIALSELDEHFARQWTGTGAANLRAREVRRGLACYRIVRYADDFVVLAGRTKDQARDLWNEVGQILGAVGLRFGTR